MFKKFSIMLKKSKKRRRRKKQLLYLSKRKKLVLVTALITFGFWGLSYFQGVYRYMFIGVLTVISAILVTWALREDLKGITWLVAPILPMMFVASVSLFNFLLPEKILTRLILIVLFAIGMYAILLTENIFTVSALRTIQLLRAAQALGFLFSLIVSFLMFDTIFSFYFNPFYNFLLIFLVSIPICLQGVWSGSLEEKLNLQIWKYTFSLAFIIGQGAFFVSMWPVNIIVTSLFLVTILYVGLGLIQQAMAGRLFKATINEYMRVGVLVFVILLVMGNW